MLDAGLLNKIPGSIDIIIKERTGSTNDDAKEMLSCGRITGKALIVADEQSAGRGRQGKSFLSPKGGLYMTLVLPCSSPIGKAVEATSCSAVAVVRAIKKVCGIDAGIKWVNDIYVGGGKLCGILVEAVNDYSTGVTNWLVIGIGVNINESPKLDGSLPASPQPTSLASLGVKVSRELLCAGIASELISMSENGFDFSAVSEEYSSHSVLGGKDVTFYKNGIARCGQVLGFDKRGALVVDCGGEIFILDSGEISVRINEQESER